MPSEPSTSSGPTSPRPTPPAPPADRPTSRRRTWPQRLTIALIVLTSLGCFGAAAALGAGQWVVSQRNLVVLTESERDVSANTPDIVVPGETRPPEDAAAPVTTTADTFPPADPEANNFLITGADNNACVDPDSPYAGAFGDRANFGERSDTIMVWRVDPSTDQVAVLSFPRDLYVTVDGGSKARINSAYRRDDPSRLQDTIFLNFQIPIDHYIQVDFCAFKRLVDGVGGVKVPFEYAARDTNTGLDVQVSGGECFEFDGDHALAYVRSRHYEYLVDGEWKPDGTSDFGRISRQQDFLRRTVASLLSRGPFSPSVATALLQTNRQYLTIDSELTVGRMLEFAGVLRSLDPNAIASYQIESTSQNVSGQSVQIPRIKGENMQAILAIFRGEAPLAAAPDQIFESTTSAVPLPGVTTGDSAPTTATTAPAVGPEENTLGISPPRDITC
jgi:LCP family protein required for cell wall assembly